jgi:hypothetical protein
MPKPKKTSTKKVEPTIEVDTDHEILAPYSDTYRIRKQDDTADKQRSPSFKFGQSDIVIVKPM